jgi:hypothetical protein
MVCPTLPVDPATEWVTTEREKIALLAEGWDVFCNALINPPQPNEKLKAAAPLSRALRWMKPEAIELRARIDLRTYQEQIIKAYRTNKSASTIAG